MLRILLILALTGFVSLKTTAQTRDWSTVQETDTPYFAGGVFHTKSFLGGRYTGIFTRGRLIRRITVDSVQQIHNERKLFFPQVWRDIDSGGFSYAPFARLKSGWQGSFCRQIGDGVDEFYNFLGDTIRIHIRATPVASWKLVTDSSGLEIRASITSMGGTMLNGITDSFREATLQAYQNNFPVPHLYNGRKLRWTKAQGWVRTLDWYVFPYGVTKLPGYLSPPIEGAKEDTASYDRIDDTLDLSKGRTIADLQARYAPGNAWRTYGDDGNYVGRGSEHYLYFHDSVLNLSLSGNKCIVQLQRDSCDFLLVYPTGAPNPGYWRKVSQMGILHTDTIIADSARINKRQWILPEVTVSDSSSYPKVWNFLLTDSFCGRPQVCAEFSFNIQPAALGNAPPPYVISSFNEERNCYQNVTTIGTTMTMYCSANAVGPVPFKSSLLEYLKTAACTYGSYVDVLALSVGATAVPENTITLSPNPADQLVYLNAPDALTGSHFIITDLQGKSVLNGHLGKGETAVSVAELPTGFYLIKVWGAGLQQVQKLLIQR